MLMSSTDSSYRAFESKATTTLTVVAVPEPEVVETLLHPCGSVISNCVEESPVEETCAIVRFRK